MQLIVCLLSLLVANSLWAADGKLLATPGISQIEGAAGGGFVPWAQLAGYGSRDEISGNIFCSRGNTDNYHLNVCGAQLGLYDTDIKIMHDQTEHHFEINKLVIARVHASTKDQSIGLQLEAALKSKS